MEDGGLSEGHGVEPRFKFKEPSSESTLFYLLFVCLFFTFKRECISG